MSWHITSHISWPLLPGPGVPIPRTVITNNPDCARAFINEIGVSNTVYKTFLATEECWRETRILRDEELEILDQVRLAPVIFQEYVPALSDIRVTVVGPTMFATAISPTPDGYAVDYRMDTEAARFEPTGLPRETVTFLRKMMDRLGLVYGAIDLRRTANKGGIFLEVNPAGEWRFVEERTKQPITQAVAELLRELDRPKS